MVAPCQRSPTTGADASGDPAICSLATARQVDTPPVPPSSMATMGVSPHWYLRFLVHPSLVATLGSAGARDCPTAGTVGKQVSWQ